MLPKFPIAEMPKMFSVQSGHDFCRGTKMATGALLGKRPIVCGGYTETDLSDSVFSDACYEVTDSNTTFVINMTMKRAGAASVVVNGTKLWVTGGAYDFGFGPRALIGTEYIELEKNESITGRVTRCGDFSPNFGYFW